MARTYDLPRSAVARGMGRVRQDVLAACAWPRERGGWVRILRNALVGYVEQAGGRMAAALSFYSLFLGGPALVLTLALGSMLFGEQAAKETVIRLSWSLLPPVGAGGPELFRDTVRASAPTAGLAAVAGLSALLGFTRALSTSINVSLRAEGIEPIQRTLLVGPLLLVAVLLLLGGAWAFQPLVEMAELERERGFSWPVQLLLAGLAPFALAFVSFATILAVVPRIRLTAREVLVPALAGALLWEAARHLFSWLVGGDNFYLRVFGPLGGSIALLGWVYLSSAILIFTGQLAWAYAMERRGRGRLAYVAPRQAGPDGWLRVREGEHAVNEDLGR